MTELSFELRAFLDDVVEVFGGGVVEAFVIGSAATDAFDPAASDLDMVVVIDEPLDDRSALVSRLQRLKPPARDLELVVYVRGAQPPRFELNFSGGMERPDEPWFWFVLDAALAQEHALPIRNGRAWLELFDIVSGDEIRAALQDSLAWSERQAPDDEFARLNAIRSRHYLDHEEWLSKREAQQE